MYSFLKDRFSNNNVKNVVDSLYLSNILSI
jgi:hypothetical protein